MTFCLPVKIRTMTKYHITEHTKTLQSYTHKYIYILYKKGRNYKIKKNLIWTLSGTLTTQKLFASREALCCFLTRSVVVISI